MASSRGLDTLYSETNAISVNNGLGQGLPMASSCGVGNLNFNVERGSGIASINGSGQGPPVASSR